MRPVALPLLIGIACALGGCAKDTKHRTTDATVDGTISIDPSPLPDLTITDQFQATSASAVTLDFSVVNAGGADASNIAWRVTRADGSVVDQGTVPFLEPGGKAAVHVADGAQGVNQTFTIAVDPDGAIAESHEDNNSLEITSVYIDTGTTIDGDLALNGVHHHGAFYYPDPMFHFFIENNTAQDLSGIEVKIHDDLTGSDVWTYAEKTLIPAHSVGPRDGSKSGPEWDGLFYAPYTSTPAAPGRHTYHVILDPNNKLSETDESNNDWRVIIDVGSGYGYWPLKSSSDPNGDGYKTDVMYKDPHVHPADTQRYITFHGWLVNHHPTKNLVGYDLLNTPDDAGYPGVRKRIVPFVLKREGVPVAIPAPGLDANRQRNFGVASTGKAYFVLPDAGIAAAEGTVEYLFIVQEPESVGDWQYTLDLDPDNVIDEQYEGTNAGQGTWDNNHASWVISMDPLGHSG